MWEECKKKYAEGNTVPKDNLDKCKDVVFAHILQKIDVDGDKHIDNVEYAVFTNSHGDLVTIFHEQWHECSKVHI